MELKQFLAGLTFSCCREVLDISEEEGVIIITRKFVEDLPASIPHHAGCCFPFRMSHIMLLFVHISGSD